MTDDMPKPTEEVASIVMDWRVLERELGDLGNKLDQLRARDEAAGDAALRDLSARYEEISRQVLALKETSQDQMLDAMSDNQSSEALGINSAVEQVKEKAGELGGTIADAATTSSDAIAAAGQQAKDMANAAGGNLSLAWQSFKNDVEETYNRLTASKDQTDQHRDS